LKVKSEYGKKGQEKIRSSSAKKRESKKISERGRSDQVFERLQCGGTGEKN